MKFNIIGGSKNANIYIDNEIERDGIITFDIKMTFQSEEIPESFGIQFFIPEHDIYSVWSPSLKYNHALNPNWLSRVTQSRLASNMPLHSLLSIEGNNKMTVAISDAQTPISISTGVCEDDARIEWYITFFTVKVAPLSEYCATVRIDTRNIPFYLSVYDVVDWWESECGYTPAPVPEHARLPMNSLWYSYHQALDVEDILKECRLSKAIGMDTVIVDDGWQTDDKNRGYKFCGDWEVATSKIPDMKKFVDEVHKTGMKIMLWFSVPFMGEGAKNYSRFKDMLLDAPGSTNPFACLDPRYKEVRDFLVGIYSNAVREWGLDGLKLDFIDSFALKGRSLEFDEKRDFSSLEEAIDCLMTEVMRTLREINPDILIEFRQSYVGPAIRKYGNILRVADCPGDAIKNRQDVIDLRLTSGRTAVHSDMLLWNYTDTPESAALQFIATLYGVPQISVKIDKLPPEHKKMLEFYISFWKQNRDILLDGDLIAQNPEGAYSIACAEKDGRAIFTCYTDRLVDCTPYREVIAVNSAKDGNLIIKGAKDRSYKVIDCMGQMISQGTVKADLCEIRVPLSGMIAIEA